MRRRDDLLYESTLVDELAKELEEYQRLCLLLKLRKEKEQAERDLRYYRHQNEIMRKELKDGNQ